MTNSRLFDSLAPYLDATRDERVALYKWFHRNPELSMQETRTKARIIEELGTVADLEIVDVGAGVVALLRNGEGTTLAMRADFDALPVREETGVDYASTATQISERTGQEVPIAHMCGHDMHTTWLLTTVKYLAEHRGLWSGTFEAVFQPAEETAEGGKDMVAAGITGRIPVPEVMLGQHVMGGVPLAGVATRTGLSFSQASTVKVTVRGVGTHGSMPEKGVDPIVLTSSIIMQLQTIVSREISAVERAVVSVGTIHGGTKSNVIPEEVVFEINTRCYSQEIEDGIHASIERIVTNQSRAAGRRSPPSNTPTASRSSTTMSRSPTGFTSPSRPCSARSGSANTRRCWAPRTSPTSRTPSAPRTASGSSAASRIRRPRRATTPRSSSRSCTRRWRRAPKPPSPRSARGWHAAE